MTPIPGARRGPFPGPVEVQLATLVGEVPDGGDWVHELKLDGYRVVARRQRGRVTLVTRKGLDWTQHWPPVAAAVAGLPAATLVLDGEVAVVEADGRTSFQALQNLGGGGRLTYFVFDLLYLDGWDLRGASLLARKQALAELCRGAGEVVRFSDHVVEAGPALFREACARGLEGTIAKRAQAPYRGGRGADWLKIKCTRRQELVIGGYTEPSGSRTGLGALLLGVQDGGQLRYVGKVGTGFTARSLAELTARLGPLAWPVSPFSNLRRGKGVHWVEPRLVAEVAFTEWTADGRLRHPSFQGLREDKRADEVVREKEAAMKVSKRRVQAPRRARRPAASPLAGDGLSHPERMLWQEAGISKRQLADYYVAMAERILPHLAGRPLSIVRCPGGLGAVATPPRQGQGPGKGACFFQKHAAPSTPAAIGRVEAPEKGGPAIYLEVHDVPGLVGLAQIGALELHPWGARARHIEAPDRMIFDLDPGPGVAWDAVAAAALEVRGCLHRLDLVSFVKTTGGKGLHVVVPLTGRNSWDEVKDFSHAVAQSLARSAPDRYLAHMAKAARGGRIFIDYLRNARGQTAVAPWSPRARPGATVSTPIAWDELAAGVDPATLTVVSLPALLARRRRDPWADLATTRQSLTAAMRKAAARD